MRYIGSKRQVLPFIHETVTNTYGDYSSATIADLFTGTACVAEMFKRSGASVITNDYMPFSYALQIEKIGLNQEPECKQSYEQCLKELNHLDGVEGFFFSEYSLEGSVGGKYSRNYFSAKNAKKIDAIRQKISEWLSAGTISSEMYYLLIANLLDAVTRVSNTSGTYGSFLKVDDPRKERPIRLEKSSFYNNQKQNLCYCKDIFDLIDTVHGDILYLDPPYNARQYPPYYHILDTVALYDRPAIYGKTGRRPYQDKLSPLCMADKAEDALFNLVERAAFNHIYISYSTDGIIDYQRLAERLQAIGTTDCFFMPHRRYKSNSANNTPPKATLKEIILYVQK